MSLSTSSFDGVFAATLTPFDAQGEVDPRMLATHFADVAAVEGMKGILCNGHAGENHLLARTEAAGVVLEARRALPAEFVVAAGVLAESSNEAAIRAQDAEQAGADAVVVFPPFSWAVGGDGETVVRHHRAIRDATDLPLVLYMAHHRSGTLSYSPDVLRALFQIEGVMAIKEGSWDINLYAQTRAIAAEMAPDVAVMGSADEGLYPMFAIGTVGSMVSLAVVAGREIVDLYRAVRRGDHASACALHETLQPLATAIYARPPQALAVARLKRAQELLGRWDRIHARLPAAALDESETATLRSALVTAGLVS